RLISEIVHGIVTRKGFMVLTGEIGLGKTTISRKILGILDEKGVETSLVFHTSYQDVEMLKEINRDFGLKDEDLQLGDQMTILRRFLLEQNGHGKNCAIIIDDAQNLNRKSLELVRMISNLETDQQKLVQILLIGQPELVEKLNSPDLRQLKSRIIIRREARPLNVEELKNYLLFKLNAAGNQGKTTVKNSAVKKIHKLSKGNFRQINTLMDRCLYAAFVRNTTEISKDIVREAYRDLSPDRPSMLKRPLSWGVATLLILVILGGATYFGFFRMTVSDSVRNLFFRPSTSVLQSNKEMPPANEGPADYQALRDSRQTTLYASPQKIEKKIAVPVPIADFLSIYGLSEYGESFIKALENQQFQEISETIYEQTRYRLIRLDYMPDRVRQKYGVLAYPSGPEGKETFFLFWQPKLRFDKFYYSYRGEKILELQEMLAIDRFYRDQLDGIVGRNLMKAIIDFQKKMGLPITGYPDERTIFLLCNRGVENRP
ncbi:MAG: AAA family ATPase, partial [Deltaproteobacteria bacterium]|nr:AAA family ATPase [Deltaproteobacteria bacterium]